MSFGKIRHEVDNIDKDKHIGGQESNFRQDSSNDKGSNSTTGEALTNRMCLSKEESKTKAVIKENKDDKWEVLL